MVTTGETNNEEPVALLCPENTNKKHEALFLELDSGRVNLPIPKVYVNKHFKGFEPDMVASITLIDVASNNKIRAKAGLPQFPVRLD